VAVERGGGDRRAASDRAIGRAAGVRVPVRRRPDGRPEVLDLPLAVSAAHCGELTLGVAGLGPLGCDLERVTPRPASLWRDLLGADGHRLAGEIAREAGEELDAAATRVWSARECLRKAGMPHDAPLVIGSAAPDGWVVLSSGALRVPTIILRVREGDAVAAAVLAGSGEDAGTPAPSAARPELAVQGAG
jgi:enediyne polyketide synthase